MSMLYRGNQVDAAAALLADTAQRWPSSPWPLFELGQVHLFHQGRPQEGLLLMQAVRAAAAAAHRGTCSPWLPGRPSSGRWSRRQRTRAGQWPAPEPPATHCPPSSPSAQAAPSLAAWMRSWAWPSPASPRQPPPSVATDSTPSPPATDAGPCGRPPAAQGPSCPCIATCRGCGMRPAACRHRRLHIRTLLGAPWSPYAGGAGTRTTSSPTPFPACWPGPAQRRGRTPTQRRHGTPRPLCCFPATHLFQRRGVASFLPLWLLQPHAQVELCRR